MKIKLSPMRMDETLTASVHGDAIKINDVNFDFGQFEDGESLPASAVNSPWVCGAVYRKNGEINMTLILPHGANAPHETRYPSALTEPMTIVSGLVQLPPYDSEDEA